MNNDERTIVFQCKLGDDEYEIKSVLPNWHLTKYLISRYSDLTKDSIDEKTTEVFDEISGKCFRGWRIGSEGEWNTDFDVLPGAIVLHYVLALATQAGVKVTTTVKTKKN